MVEPRVVYASSHDPSFPPSAMLDGRGDTFWASGGLYPQVFVVSLPALTSIDNLALVTYNVRKVQVERSIKTQPTDFQEMLEKEVSHTEGKLQTTVLTSQPQVSAVHLRITIAEGYDHFFAIHKLAISGSEGSGGRQDTGGGAATGATLAPPPLSPPHTSPPSQRAPLQVEPQPSTITVVGDEDDDIPTLDGVSDDEGSFN